MTQPRKATPEQLAEANRILDEHPELREAIADGPLPRRTAPLREAMRRDGQDVEPGSQE